MKGWEVNKMMNEFKFQNLKVTKIIHDKDSSTIINVMNVYVDVKETLCFSSIIIIINITLNHGCEIF